MTLTELKEIFERYIVLKDKYILDLIMATVISNLLLDDDPVWLQIVAPSSSGKTTLIAPALSIAKTHAIDDLTPNTFLSGFNIKGKNTSMLHIIGSGVMVFSDFTNILAKNKEALGEILSQLKLIYDGNFTKFTGTGKIAPWVGKMGCLSASTPDIYHFLESGRSTGERFLYYWMDSPTDAEISEKQNNVKISSKAVTDLMKEIYLDYFNSIDGWIKLHGVPELKVTAEQRRIIQEAAAFCVHGKATVHTNFYTGKADRIPNKASVGRDNKMFDAVLHACQIMDAYEANKPDQGVQDCRIEMVRKCAYSAINRERRKVLEILSETEISISSSKIGVRKNLGFSREAVELYLVPLHAVGLIQKQVDGKSFKWFIAQDSVRKFVKEVSPMVHDPMTTNMDTGVEEEETADDLAEMAFREF